MLNKSTAKPDPNNSRTKTQVRMDERTGDQGKDNDKDNDKDKAEHKVVLVASVVSGGGGYKCRSLTVSVATVG
jgi:hypothetical protein